MNAVENHYICTTVQAKCPTCGAARTIDVKIPYKPSGAMLVAAPSTPRPKASSSGGGGSLYSLDAAAMPRGSALHRRIHQLGVNIYGKGAAWDSARHQLIRQLTSNQSESISRLDADGLIDLRNLLTAIRTEVRKASI